MKISTVIFYLGRYSLFVLSILLATAAWLYFTEIKTSSSNDQEHLRSLARAIENELKVVNNHVGDLRAERKSFQQLYREAKVLGYPCYLYNDKRLTFWSDFDFAPSSRDINEDFEVKAVIYQDSYYLLRKYDLGGDEEAIYAIPLAVKYPIVNEYLKSKTNLNIFASENFEISLTQGKDFHPVSINDSILFFIKLNPNYGSLSPFQYIIVNLLSFLSILCFLIFLWQRCRQFIRKSRYLNAFLLLFFGLLLLRAGMIFFNYPFLVFPGELFNPRNYASSFINPSLGDLLLNVATIFTLAAFLFRYYPNIRLVKRYVANRERSAIFISGFLLFLSLVLLSVFFLLLNSLNFHSQWSLDISREINFHFLKIISYGIVILGGLAYFFLSHIIFRLILYKYREDWKTFALVLLLGIGFFVVVALLDRWDFVVITVVSFCYLLVLRVFKFPQYLRRIQYLTFVYFFVASLPLCIVGAYSIYRYQHKKIIQEKDKLASQLLVDNDVLTEYLLNEAAGQIASDVFIQNRILNPYVSKVNIRQRVQRVYLNNQLEKYDVGIFLFNSQGTPIDGSSRNLHDILDQYSSFKIDSTLYFVNQYEASALKRYLKVVEVTRYSRVAGYVLIDLKLKRVIPNSVYPLLLIDNRYSGPDISTDYSYALYENGNLLFNFGDYNYAEKLGGNFQISGTGQNTGYHFDELVHFLVKGQNNRVYVISIMAYPVQNAFSNFSFLLVLFLGAILLALIAITLFFKIKGVQQNYASRIQLFLNAAFLTPLMIISVSTISIIVKSYDENLELENLEQATNISTRVSENLDAFLNRDISRENLSEEINSISQFAEIDINVFGNTGRLLATSQPLIYENNLLAEVINPEAYLRIVYGNAGGMVLNEHIGRLAYKNTYIPIKSLESGQRIGILSLPYFDVKKELEENVISVLTNVLNIFTVIFLIFLLLSYFASTWLTFPLRLITQKIRKTSWLDTNEPLEWNSDDEIGLMVGEYNKMLVNLEESKKALARSEKESAWREIARQVAHEIKNPLTPMQLTLQHMRRTLTENQIDKDQRIRQIDALLHQIGTLNDIATSFSTFARMPVPEKGIFNLSELVKDTVAIYDKNDQLTIETSLYEQEFFIDADKKWIGQAISNILINAIHAVEEKTVKRIEVSLKKQGKNKCLLTIADSGKGISEDIKGKIFMPDFSTKLAGSGIGLAITKRAIEHAGGEIWFESEIDKGTAFYIELPLVKS